MRAGTQTLIQALQSIPWADDQDNDDEIVNHNISAAEIESDEEDKPSVQLSSSLHTIHRPMARSRRAGTNLKAVFNGSDTSEPSDDEQEPDQIYTSEPEDTDFEVATPRIPDHTRTTSNPEGRNTIPSRSIHGRMGSHSTVMTRTGSMATVRLQRRARLADKLREVFDLDGIEEVISEMPCWLLRSVLLQGYMYLTNSYLCFFAHMPAREDQVLKSGSLHKKAQRTKRWIKHWFVLKNDVLSWYQSSSDPYFPHGMVDLRYAMSCEHASEKEFRIRTNEKTIILAADSIPSRDEWVKAIRKVMFKAQNRGDSIAIPYSAIIDVEKSAAIDFSETIEVKVLDKDENYAVDSYFFAYFHELPVALDQIRDAVRNNRAVSQTSSPLPVMDTTTPRVSTALPVGPTHPTTERAQTVPTPDTPRASAFRLASLWRPFQDSPPIHRATSAPTPERPEENEEFTHISKRTSFIPHTSSPDDLTHAESSDSSLARPSTDNNTPKLHPSVLSVTDHTYPPQTTPGFYDLPSKDSSSSSWGVPTWLRVPSRKVFTAPFGSSSTTEHGSTVPIASVTEIYSTNESPTSSNQSGETGFSVLDVPDATIDAAITAKFRAAFALDDKEVLLGYFPGYIYRLLPVYGRLYISTNFFCFKSSGPLASRTRMMLPIRDVLATEKSKAFHFGHFGLVIIVKGHEELFFEFGLEERRVSFIHLLKRQMEDSQRRLANGESPTPGRREASILEAFDSRTSLVRANEPKPPPESMTESLPAIMFTSASSTFLTFKPTKSLHFTFLTIGSRGDVQPYIALAKGLKADGHRVRIATHGEFKQWIEAHGIEFGYVGGDPAELMRICVENGTFTVSFLKEGLMKFRGWIDDLLKTSWEACQGTDVLVESPSAMAGYHIAEALKIPYFRAFTMTWSRTRAYPHAFAVPEHKMGGGYNYMSYVMFDQVFWRAISGQINRWRRNQLGLASTNLDRMEPHKIPFLYNFSPVVVPPPLDWPEWIRVTGYWFLDDAEVGSKTWDPPPSLVKFIDSAHNSGKKVVYIGFGSIVVSDPKAMTHCVVEAIVRSGVHAILSKGWSDRLHKTGSEVSKPEEPLPEQIYPINSLPHDWLFNRIDAACHHGGAGTTGASLRAGIPTIIKPFFGDQFFWADRVEALGVGSGVRKLTVEGLTEALVAATTDPKQIARAKILGEEIRAEKGVATAIEAIYRDLEYARSLIKRGAPEDVVPDVENTALRDSQDSTPQSTLERPGTGDSSSERASEDWSVISEHEGQRRTSFGSRQSEIKADQTAAKRSSLSAAVLSVFPTGLTIGSPLSSPRSPSRPRT
ncbi:glycosyltransferase family 1 protein [Jaapia argillacea MUCL 33604]|uniref:Sterol 3-beta-glucosyltransferase n=1 Tax=Jaapia argillacea MUCL 33604 TaxID=933084 RepID=A0A067PJ55_9AGAM|nr:glycosyltransferase family 1 protein [Jaapia argillacea MUCL 33604]